MGRAPLSVPLLQGTNKEHLEMSFRVVFIVSSPDAPPEGDLVGDVLYVNAPDGYRNIVHKVKHMMGLVSVLRANLCLFVVIFIDNMVT